MDDSAALFEAISHPVRIRILKILERQASSFASLKRALGIDSSGNLDHHLKKLGHLIGVQEDGLYALTDDGREALVSIKAIEAWKEEERLKARVFSGAPRTVTILAFLELCTATMAVILFSLFVLGLDGNYSESFGLLLWPTHLTIGVLGFLSFDGLNFRKGWSWEATIVQAALMVLSGIAPIYYSIVCLRFSAYSLQRGILFDTVGATIAVLFVCGIAELLLALRPTVREFLGKKFGTPMPRRAFIGGVIGLSSGIYEMLAASWSLFGPHAASSVSGSGAIIPMFMLATSLPLSLGGLLILLRKYTSGGATMLIFSFAPFPTYYIALTTVLVLLNFSLLGYLVAIVLGIMPIASGILALISRN